MSKVSYLFLHLPKGERLATITLCSCADGSPKIEHGPCHILMLPAWRWETCSVLPPARRWDNWPLLPHADVAYFKEQPGDCDLMMMLPSWRRTVAYCDLKLKLPAWRLTGSSSVHLKERVTGPCVRPLTTSFMRTFESELLQEGFLFLILPSFHIQTAREVLPSSWGFFKMWDDYPLAVRQ